jgi:hypothetical protein
MRPFLVLALGLLGRLWLRGEDGAAVTTLCVSAY